MGFIDDLSLILDLLVLVPAAIFYTGVMVWFEVRRKDLVRAGNHLREGAVLLGLLGLVIGIFALWGELTWPINGFPTATSYDLFFFDVLTLMAILLVAFALAVRMRYPTHMVGMLGVIIGIGVLFYAFRAYQLSLTLQPLDTLMTYLAFGAMSIMSYPATLYIDWFVIGPTTPGADPLPSDPTPAYPKMWWGLLGLFLLSVFLSGLAAVLYGVTVVWGHLGAPP